jgi:hypothetical protein
VRTEPAVLPNIGHARPELPEFNCVDVSCDYYLICLYAIKMGPSSNATSPDAARQQCLCNNWKKNQRGRELAGHDRTPRRSAPIGSRHERGRLQIG